MEEKLDEILELLEKNDVIYWVKVVIIAIAVYLGIKLVWTLFVPKRRDKE